MKWPSLVFFLKLSYRGKWTIMERLWLVWFSQLGWLSRQPLVRNFVSSEAIKWDLTGLVFLMLMNVTFLQKVWDVIHSVICHILKGILASLIQIQRFEALSGNRSPVEIVILDNSSVVKFCF